MGISKIKLNGIVYTPKELGSFISDEIVKEFNFSNKSKIVIVEPSIGTGDLLFELLNKLHSFKGKIKIIAFDTEREAIIIAKKKILNNFNNVEFCCNVCSFVDAAINYNYEKADIIISNPPYVRTNLLDKKLIYLANDKFQLNGKVDLYHIFLYLFKNIINTDGVIGVVTSNKFLYNKTGINLRQYLFENYSIKAIYDFGDTKLFKNVSVLPAVTILKKSIQKTKTIFITAYSTSYISKKNCSIFEAINNCYCDVNFNGNSYKINRGYLEVFNNNWRIKNDCLISIENAINKNSDRILSNIAKVRVGIKTTADKVFISNKWNKCNCIPELLYPLITHRIASQYRQKEDLDTKVLYPYCMDKEKAVPVDLEKFPSTKKYLEMKRDVLESRKYIYESKKKWFEIWVPHSPKSWKKKKIIFKDISEHPCFWLCEDEKIVNGDCYWIDFQSNVDEDDIWMILGVFNSDFIENYYDANFNNKLYSGRRRFMAQYVSQFPLLNHDNSFYNKIVELSKKTYKNPSKQNITELNELVNKAFYS